jgi:DNA-binding response OmpR family regulator
MLVMGAKEFSKMMDVNKVILVIEDEEPIRDLLKDFFTEEGYKVVAAGSAAEALTLLQSVVCNIILLDFNLPGVDGNAFLDLLPDNAKSIPIIVVSATSNKFKSHPQIKTRVEKPFDLFKLGKLVEKFV